jgi:hypothetical protein
VISTKLALFMFARRFGLELTCQPHSVSSYRSARKLGAAEEVLLPYEWGQESSWLWRTFRVPAAVLNRVLSVNQAGRGTREGRYTGPLPAGSQYLC